MDGIVQPLWSGRAGRAYGDEATGALTAWVAIPATNRFAIALGGRAAASRAGGLVRGRDGLALMEAHGRARFGPLALDVGRAAVGWDGELLLSPGAPPLDLIRLTTDRSLALPVLGALETDFFLADMGPNHTYANALLFGMRFSGRLAHRLRLGLSLMNKQGGEGGPAASLTDRIKDLTFVWDLFRRDDDYLFSDKMVGVDVSLAVPERGLRLEAEIALTDFDHERLQDTFVDVAAYRVEAVLSRLGRTERHAVAFEGRYTGPLMYRHHQYTSGHTVDQHFLGSSLGPDGRSGTVSYRYRAPTVGWRLSVDVTLEERRVDEYSPWHDPRRPIEREEVFPAETRTRLEASWNRLSPGGRTGIEVRGGVEAVSNVGHESGLERVYGALRIRLWWGL